MILTKFSPADIAALRQTADFLPMVADLLPRLQQENRSLQNISDAMEEKLESIERDIRTLLNLSDDHFAQVKVNEAVARERELIGLAAHTRLRQLFPKEEQAS